MTTAKDDAPRIWQAKHERPPYQRPGLIHWIAHTSLLVAVFALVAFAIYVVVFGPQAVFGLEEEIEEVVEDIKMDVDDDLALPPMASDCANASDDTMDLGGITSFAIGLDASIYPRIPWKTAREHGVGFALIPATKGAQNTDGSFADNWSMVKKCGILRSAVHTYTPDAQAELQARNLLSQIANDPGELPPIVDIERAFVSSKKNCLDLLGELSTFSQLVEQGTSMPVTILTTPDYWQKKLNCKEYSELDTTVRQLAAQPLFVLQPQVDAPTLFGDWHGWRFWRYRNDGRIGHKKVAVDRYVGSEADLMVWSQGIRAL
ncbi:MAG: hypothetical protein HN348_06065 [Proteobacteria bacterium]|nr:hypothetical protein [Pseudomonadota bacterium]